MNQKNLQKKKLLIIYKFKFSDPKIFEKKKRRILKQADILGINIKYFCYLPTKKSLYTVLRSPHVNKKSREQFYLQTHKRILCTEFDFHNNNDKKRSKIFMNFIKNYSSGLELNIKYKIL